MTPRDEAEARHRAKAQAEYDAATPEELAEFEKNRAEYAPMNFCFWMEARGEVAGSSPEQLAEFERYYVETYESALPEGVSYSYAYHDWRQRRRWEELYAEVPAEERAAFHTYEQEDIAEEFLRWRTNRKDEAKRAERRELLKVHGFTVVDRVTLSRLSDDLWEQISSLIAGGAIKPAPTPPSEAQPGAQP